MHWIESASNPKIKRAAQLVRRSGREKASCFVAEGVRLAEMAAASDWNIDYALVTERAAKEERARAILARLEARDVPAFLVPERVYAKAGATETPQGLLLVVQQKYWTLNDLRHQDSSAPCYVVLDRVQDPGNLGTILRTADAAGMDGVILLKGTVDAFSPKVVRAAMGSLFHLPVVLHVEEEAFLAFAEAEKLALYATALDATAKPHFAADFCRPSAIVFGNEGNGVSETVLERAERIYIPMFGGAESLNVAVSSAIVLYEAVRQRHAGISG